ncbi:MAG: hypothetical protein GYA58_03975 [Anaerolineaceae bacterium]|nr:hypothetical protein [Anaerolineaceae bacterium]
MKTAEEQLQRLKIWERIIGFYISVILLFCAAIILFHPPLSLTITEKNGTVVSTNTIESSNAHEQIMTSSNQSTVIIILLVASCIFMFYSIHGLRFTKVSINKDGVSAECNVSHNSSKEPASGKQENEYQNKTFFERKILNTLWRYQQRYTSPDEHWTFTLYNSHPEYANFQWAITKLIESKLVYFDRSTEQYSLTYDGIEFMEKAKAEPAEEGEFYPFIVKGYR